MSTAGYTPNYRRKRPYAYSIMTTNFLTYYVHRQVPASPLDKAKYLSRERYVHRPDLLAFDLYGRAEWWWVIPVRNGLQDPIFDLQLGRLLWIPDPSTVQAL